MSNDVLILHDGPRLCVTINRPQQGNAMTDAMSREVIEALDRAHLAAEFVLLRGAGADFCTGRARNPDGPPPSAEAYIRRDEYETVFELYSAIRRCQVPVVGMVEGRAMGLGAAMAALCDVSFASETASFNVPEMAANILPTMVLSALFDRMNRNAIAWMAYSREFISAERALNYGLISHVVPPDRLEQTVEEFCAKLASTPRPAIRGLKEYLRVAPTMNAQGAVDYARSLHAMVNTASSMKKTGGAH